MSYKIMAQLKANLVVVCPTSLHIDIFRIGLALLANLRHVDMGLNICFGVSMD